jgi:hypothetical protein
MTAMIGKRLCHINMPRLAAYEQYATPRRIPPHDKADTQWSLDLESRWAKMGQIWARKQNAHMKWAFATSLEGMDVGCAGKI